MRMGDSGYCQYLTWVEPGTIPGPAVPLVTTFDTGQTVPETETWFLHNWSVDTLESVITAPGSIQIVLSAYNSPPDLQFGRVATLPVPVVAGALAVPLQTGIVDPPLLLPGGTTFYLDVVTFPGLTGTYTNFIRTAMVTRLTGAVIGSPFIAVPPI